MVNDELSYMLKDAKRLMADISGNGYYDIRRPTYTSSTTEYTTIASRIPMRVHREGASGAAEPSFAGVPYMISLMNEFLNPLPGDIFVPNPAGNVSVPAVTCQNVDDKKNLVCFRSNKVGRLTEAVKNVIYSNVNFEIFTVGSSGDPSEDDMVGSTPYEQIKAVLWSRPNIPRRGRLLDDSFEPPIVYDIRGVTGSGFITILLLELDKK